MYASVSACVFVYMNGLLSYIERERGNDNYYDSGSGDGDGDGGDDT